MLCNMVLKGKVYDKVLNEVNLNEKKFFCACFSGYFADK